MISGVEAFVAKHDKKSVEWRLHGIDWQELTDREFMSWSADRFVEGKYEFRLKPKTIKIELDLPKWTKIHVAANNVIISFDDHDDAVIALDALRGALK